jgi:predicted protein tyrosine phosphatase
MLSKNIDLSSGLSLRRVLFVSQKQAETMRPPKNTVLISITDPSRSDASIGGGWVDILRLKFDDVDQVTFPGQDLNLKEITPDQVAAIAEFVADHSRKSLRLVVHCRHGISRSAAVAKAIAHALGIAFPAEYDEYNRFVYLALRRVIRHALTEA